MGAVLGQRNGKIFHSVNYESKALDLDQTNYTITNKQFLSIMFAFNKFRSYLVGTKVVVRVILRCFFANKDIEPRLVHWILIL